MNLLFATLKTRYPMHSPEKWQAWILANNMNQLAVRVATGTSLPYPFWRVELHPHELDSRLADFPGFADYIRSLPIELEKAMWISQIPNAVLQWHHDFDIGGVGIRICCAGDDAGELEILPTKQGKPLDASVWFLDIRKPPFVEMPFGHLREEFIPFVDPSRAFKPKGVEAGVTWLVSSWHALHRVLPVQKPRIQCILRGKIDKQALAELINQDTLIKAY